MGSDGYDRPISFQQLTDKIPLSFDGYRYHQKYKGNVVHRDLMTTIDPTRCAPKTNGQISEQTQVTAKTLLLRVFSVTGVTNLIKELRKKFGGDNATLLHDNISNFFISAGR